MSKWRWDHVNCNDEHGKLVTHYPGLRFGTTGLTVVLVEGRYSVTHDVTGKSLGFRAHKITAAKRYAECAATFVDWTLPNEEAIIAAAPAIVRQLCELAAATETRRG